MFTRSIGLGFLQKLRFQCVFVSLIFLALTLNVFIYNQAFFLNHVKRRERKKLNVTRLPIINTSRGNSTERAESFHPKQLKTTQKPKSDGKIQVSSMGGKLIDKASLKKAEFFHLKQLKKTQKPKSDGKIQVSSMSGKLIDKAFFKDIILPSTNCASGKVEIVFCVPVKRDGWAQRKTVRETWGSYVRNNSRAWVMDKLFDSNSTGAESKRDRKMFVVFFIGSSSKVNGTEEQQAIEREARMYGDIYQADYIDTYKNLTLKSISILRYITFYCPNARFLAKVDDDMYLNVPVLLNVLRQREKLEIGKTLGSSDIDKASHAAPKFVMGAMFPKGRVFRNKSNKWYTSEEEYAGEYYPKYVSGTAYAMSGPAALALYTASLEEPIFWMEDVYITGMCLRRANVTLINEKRFHSFIKRPFPSCYLVDQISSHGHSVVNLRQIYRELSNSSLECGKSRSPIKVIH